MVYSCLGHHNFVLVFSLMKECYVSNLTRKTLLVCKTGSKVIQQFSIPLQSYLETLYISLLARPYIHFHRLPGDAVHADAKHQISYVYVVFGEIIMVRNFGEPYICFFQQDEQGRCQSVYMLTWFNITINEHSRYLKHISTSLLSPQLRQRWIC